MLPSAQAIPLYYFVIVLVAVHDIDGSAGNPTAPNVVVQMDGTALPIFLVDLAASEGVIDTTERDACWPMVRSAAAFLVGNGPVSPQDRREEDPDYSPFTIAAEIAAIFESAARAGRPGRRSRTRPATRQRQPLTGDSSRFWSAARSFRFARRIAPAMKGASHLENPVGVPRFRRVIRVAPSEVVSQV